MSENSETAFDWRMWGISRLEEDLPAAYPGGPSHKKGTPVFPSSVLRKQDGELIGIIRPRPAALALNIAIKSAKRAMQMKPTIALQTGISPEGNIRLVVTENHPIFYDYLELCMVSVVFCTRCLDALCNEIIEEYLEGTVPILIKNKIKHLNKVQLQHGISTKLKLNHALPKILSLQSPESAIPEVWRNIDDLIKTRNKTVHLESKDESSGADIDKESLFFKLYNTDIMKYPRTTIDLLVYYEPQIRNAQWITDAQGLIT